MRRMEPRLAASGAICTEWTKAGAACQHPGLRHPASIGEVIEAVLYGYVVHDSDGDVITSARAGAWKEDSEADDDFQTWEGEEDIPVITYTYCTVSRWNDAVLDDEEIANGWRRSTSSPVTSPRWTRWLIEDDESDEDLLVEVRLRLGLE